MTKRGKLALLVIVLMAATISAATVSLWTLYNAAFEREREHLTAIAKSVASLIEAVGRFDSVYSAVDHPQGAKAATLSQIVAAKEKMVAWGESGDFLVGELKNGQISFLLNKRTNDPSPPAPVPLTDGRAEPMRRALSGQSGTVIGADFRGRSVLAAYEPLGDLNWGIVAKRDIAEIQKPFVRAAFISGAVTLAILICGAIFLRRQYRPVLEEIEETKTRFRMILDNSFANIGLLDTERRMIFINRAALEKWRLRRSDVIGKRFPEVISTAGTLMFDRKVKEVLETRKVVQMNMNQAFPDGKTTDIEYTIFPVIAPNGELMGAGSFGLDRTEQMHLQTQLIQSGKLASLGEMVAGITHEVTQPLSIILMNAQGALLKNKRGKLDLKASVTAFQFIEEQAKRMAELVDHMRVFSRRDGEAKSYFVAQHAAIAASLMLCRQLAVNGIDIVLDLGQEKRLVLGHQVQLEQVIMNLLSNARDAILEKGKTVNGKDAWHGKITVEFREGIKRNTVTISVTNNGVEISDAEAEKMFEPFHTTKDAGSGTGLGLSISDRIVSSMGGDIEFSRGKGDGAVFSVILPTFDEELEHSNGGSLEEKVAEFPATNSERGHLLVVEDEKAANELMSDCLRESGWRVSSAFDGAEALQLCSKDPADLVITDIRMPKCDGKTLIQRLRERKPNLPIIVVSGHIGPEGLAEDEAALRGITTIRKPVELETLNLAIIEELGTNRKSA